MGCGILVRPNPPNGSQVCLGFDGSESNDWTAIRAETVGGFNFTPTYGPDNRPTIWDPAQFGGSIPRDEVHAAVDELRRRFSVRLFYADPFDWRSEIGEWGLQFDADVVQEWPTNKATRMHESLTQFVTDLRTGAITHDGCVITSTHMANARKKAMPADRYVLSKPAGADHQKIDAVMASVLAHRAACDARSDGWAQSTDSYAYVM
jgi:phage terminase large subunit-like protein